MGQYVLQLDFSLPVSNIKVFKLDIHDSFWQSLFLLNNAEGDYLQIYKNGMKNISQICIILKY